MRLSFGVLLALISTVALNWSLFVQHQASGELPTLSLASPVRSLVRLFTNRRWLTGYGVGLAGWGIYIAALALAPLSIVQGVAAGGIGVLAVAVRLAGRTALIGRQIWGTAAATGGLLLLLATLSAGHSNGSTPGLGSILGLLGVIVAAGVLLASGASMTIGPGPSLGALSGILYGAGDIATKGAFGRDAAILVPVLIALHVSGFVFLQLSFQRAGALASGGVSSLLTNALPIGAGVWFFHESVPGVAPEILRAVAFAAVVAGAALLASEHPSTEVGNAMAPQTGDVTG